jgi:hypothetical protein
VTQTIRVLSDLAKNQLIMSERPTRYFFLEPNGKQTLIGRHMGQAYNRVRAEAAEKISDPEERKKFWHVSYTIQKNAQFGVTGMARVF